MPRSNFRLPLKALAVHACLVLAALQFAACSSRQQRAENYYESGKNYLAKKEYVKARVQFSNALQIKDNLVTAWRGLAEVDEHFHKWPNLSRDLRRIVELDAKDFKSRTKLAKLYLLGGAADKALTMVNAAAELQTNNADIHALKAAILFKLKDNDGATREANKALELDPGNPDASVVLAAKAYLDKNPAEALKILGKVNRAHADDLGVVALKIDIYNQMGKLDEVEKLLKGLVQRYPKRQAFRTQLIKFYLAHKRPADAEKELRTIVAANPKDVGAELQLVNLLLVMKGHDAAHAELAARIKQGGHVFPYRIATAQLDFAQGKFDDGVKLLQGLIDDSKLSSDEVLEARTALAEMYVKRNDMAKAEPQVTEILKSDSHNTQGLRLRASIRLSRNQYDDAIADLREALNNQPRSPQLLGTLAVAYERSGSIELASDAYLKATRDSNYSPTYGLSYVAFLQRRGLETRAETVLAELAGRNPNNIAVLSAMAKVKLAHKDWAAAHAIAEKIRSLGDKRDVILADQIQGVAFGGEKKYSDSLQSLQDVYHAVPGAIQPMVAIVNTYMHSNQMDKAEAFLQSALKANPNNAEALVLLGSIQLAKKQPDKAVEDFKTAIARQPTSDVGYKALAEMYGRQGKLEEAMKTVREGLKKQPKSFSLQLTQAGIFEAKKEYNKAIGVYETMVKQSPGSMIVANNLASLLADHRTDKASLQQAQSLSEILKNSNVPQFQDTMGWVAYRQGNYAAAVKLLEGAEGKLSKSPLVSYHLGMAYLATDQQAKAVQQFNKARNLAPNDPKLKSLIETGLKNHPVKQKDQGRSAPAAGSQSG